MSVTTNYLEIHILPILKSAPLPEMLPIPKYPDNPVFEAEFIPTDESQLVTYAGTETVQVPDFDIDLSVIPEGYLQELLYHVMYRRDRSSDKLPIYLEETICSAPHALGDLVLAARMTRGLFASLAMTVDPTVKKIARNWLLLTLQLEYAIAVIVHNDRVPGPVICSTETTYTSGSYSEKDITYYIDVDLLVDSGLTIEEAVSEVLGVSSGTD